MAQAAAILAFKTFNLKSDKEAYYVARPGAFQEPVTGDV